MPEEKFPRFLTEGQIDLIKSKYPVLADFGKVSQINYPTLHSAILAVGEKRRKIQLGTAMRIANAVGMSLDAFLKK
jgi:hypothetical protein